MPKSNASVISTSQTAALPSSFEAGLSELNALVATMEAGDAPLEQMLASYQRGSVLLKFCEAQLVAAEKQLQILADNELKPLVL